MSRADTAARVSSLMGGRPVRSVTRLQELWSGYGAIYRMRLAGDRPSSVVVKAVAPPTQGRHPRGWNTDRSHQRKLRSYEVERRWYQRYAAACGPACRVPQLLAESSGDSGWLFVLEDLDALGFSARRRDPSPAELRACLTWLAGLHARFVGRAPEDLWPTGTYWHLATRPDELQAIADPELRAAAPGLDARLSQCRFQTFVHGDAKPANFCFPPAGGPVAAVDFQYVGGGCGMKDVANLLSSSLDDDGLMAHADGYLDDYFAALRGQLQPRLPTDQIDALEAEWRGLYAFAWADFVRFLAGWSPGHWKLGRYSERLTAEALTAL